MAQKHTPAKAAPSQRAEQAHFLTTTTRHGNTDLSPEMGHDGLEHSVFVFDGKNGIDEHPVVLSLRKSGFGVQEYLSIDEARTLARALNLAADHAQERAEAAQAADWLASNAAAQKLCGVVA